MIEVKSLKKTYGDTVVLNIPYLKIEKGDRIILTGHNGSGKSTLIKILAGVITEYEGEVKTEGEIYYLPQRSVPFNKSVRKNLIYALDGDKKSKNKRCDELVKKLNLEHLQNKNAASLSGGECQRLCLGRVIAKRGNILMLDEPTSAADAHSTLIMENAIEEYCKETGCILIMTTHSEEQAERLGGKRIRLCDGERAE